MIAGVIMAVVWFVCARWAFGIIGGPIASLGKPRRLHQDLMDRLGVLGASDSRVVGLWSAAWGTARGIDYAVCLGPSLLIIMLFAIRVIAADIGFELAPASDSQVALVSTVLIGLVVVAELLADGVGLFMMGRITMELARRQRTPAPRRPALIVHAGWTGWGSFVKW